jgi:glycosyltransferase involved in cell wall biosynthesis
MTKVAVCTSVLNQSEYLKRMIDSVRAQTFEDWELIIVDDGSTEDIAGVVNSYHDTRIRFHRFDTNKGIPHGLNWALAHAEAEYVQPLSADEWIEPGKFAVQVEYLDTHPEIGCVWGLPGTQKQGMGERPTWEQFALRAHNRSREAWLRTLLNLEGIPIGGASMLMRKTCMDEIGLFDPQYFACSDLEWFVRFFKKYEGRILPYRWADADQPDTRLTAPKPDSAERFQAEMKKLHAQHALEVPPVTGKVTIGIPVFNMAKFIPDAIRSVLAQTHQDIELLIMDDASTDDLAGALAEFNDPRIKLMKFDENRGTVEAVNQMLARAEGDFFCSLAADDIIDPTFIARTLAEFKRDPWLEFVASQTDFIDADGKPFKGAHPFKAIQKATNQTRESWLRNLYYGNVYFGVGVYRTKVLQDLGGWDAAHGVLTDYEMYLRLLQRENIHVIEEDLTHTRIHAGNKSQLDAAEGRKLKQRYHDAKIPYYQPRMKVIIATPFYEMRGFSPYIVSLSGTIKMLTMYGIEHEYWELSGDSYVDRAKNTITNKFLEDPDATDLFMIDSDMQWNPDALLKMLLLPEQIVMGSYPQKNSWGTWTSLPKLREEDGKHHPIGRMLEDGSALIEAEYLAGGFIRMKRECLQQFKDKYPELIYQDGSADPSYPERIYTEFYAVVREAGLRWGEDRIFGKRMKEIGVDSWIYPNIDFGHYGIKGWLGNYDTHLRGGAPAQDGALHTTVN